MWPPQHSLITGASSGIGAALAVALARPGGRLTLLGRNCERLEEVAGKCKDLGANTRVLILDVRDRSPMADAIAKADDSAAIDLAIANAGVSGGTELDSRAMLDINIGGVLNTVEPAIRRMTERGRGRIAIMASLAGFKSFPNAPLYCASKSAVRSYGEAQAARLAPKGIMVSVLCPGFIETPLTATNPFSMPLIMTPERAARKLLAGIERGQVRVAFPRRLYMISRLLELLPSGLSRDLLGKFATRQGLKE